MKLKTRVLGATALLAAAGLLTQMANWKGATTDGRRGEHSVRFEVRTRPAVYVDIFWRVNGSGGNGGEHALRGDRAWAHVTRASTGDVVSLTITRPHGFDEKAVGYVQGEIHVDGTQVDFGQRNGVETVNLSYVIA